MRTPTTVARIAAVGALAALGTIVPISVASAADYPAGGPPPEVNPARTPTIVAGKAAARATLPFTGTDVVELTAIAGISAGVGLVIVRRSHRASTT